MLRRLTCCRRQEVKFWQHNVRNFDGSRHFDENFRTFAVKIHSDASGYAIAAILDFKTPHICNRMLTEIEKESSSTFRELLAIQHTVEVFAPSLKHQDVLLCSDSSSAVSISEKSITKHQLQNIALGVFSSCIENQIRLKIQWLPREQNMTADFLSKVYDFDDRGRTDAFFFVFFFSQFSGTGAHI